MKKSVLSIAVLVLFGATLFAQIEVGTNNNVAIGISSDVNSKLSVNHTGSNLRAAYIYNPYQGNGGTGLFAKQNPPTSNSQWSYGIYGRITSGMGNTIGVYAYAYNSTAGTGRSYGVRGFAGNSSNGYNYGVYGQLAGSRNGAGVYGTTYGDKNTNGKYAGYFYGKTKVDGDFYVKSLQVSSDKNAKKEIKDLEKNTMNKLKKVKAIKFKYKNPIELGIIDAESADTLSSKAIQVMEDMYQDEHIGLIAQELQVIYPELVKEDPSGYLGIDYIGLIPVLIEALKEQQETIENLAKKVDKLSKKTKKE